jgi:hypothetical protein
MQQPGSRDLAGSGRVLVEELGHVPDQGFDWKPDPCLKTGVEGGVLRL